MTDQELQIKELERIIQFHKDNINKAKYHIRQNRFKIKEIKLKK